MRYGALLLLMAANLPVQAQNADTIPHANIEEVTVWGFSEKQFAYGQIVYGIDSAQRALALSQSLADLLQFSSNAYLKSYGPGRIASIAMRGAGSGHTRVVWNGMNLNSPTLGESDFQILPSMAFDQTEVVAGAGGALFGTDAIGGTVNLQSQPSPQGKPKARWEQRLGSFGKQHTSVEGRYGDQHWQGKSLFYQAQADNSFPFVNRQQPGAPLQERQHARTYSIGGMQDLYWQRNGWQANAHAWYHKASRELPLPITSNRQPEAMQWDNSLRATVGLTKDWAKGFTQMRSGYVNETQQYRDDGIASLIATKHAMASLTQAQQLGKHGEIRGGLQAEWFAASGESYPKSLEEWRADAFLLFRMQGKRLHASANARYAWVGSGQRKIAPSLGGSWLLRAASDNSLKINAQWGIGFRAPTLNQRYWQPGGNSNIRPESSHSAELGLQWQRKRWQMHVQAFGLWVEDWIYWLPTANGFWSPENVQQVFNRGVEAKLVGHVGKGNWLFQSQWLYTFTHTEIRRHSNPNSIGHALFYVPAHKGSAVLSARRGNFLAMLAGTYIGRRNSIDGREMPGFFTADAQMQHRFLVPSEGEEQPALVAGIKIGNIFNASYQHIEHYPMPGRHAEVFIRAEIR